MELRKFFILTILTFGFTFLMLAKQPDKPNILWITIEDTSPHFIGCYGNSEATTPNIDNMASSGVKFQNAFATATVCSPARTAIITGLYNEQTGTGHHRSKRPLPSEIKGFPSYLKEVGYYTSNNKKTDYNVTNGKSFIQDAWNANGGKAGWWGRDSDQPFFSVFNYMSSHQSRTMTKPWNWYESFVLDKLEEDEKIDKSVIDIPPFYLDSPEMRKQLSRVYNSISLADKEIGEILNRLEEDGLKDETIIFFFADHGEGIPRGKCNPIAFGYQVPFIVWAPDKYKHLLPWNDSRETDELVSFVDLAPTVLSLAGVSIPDYMAGRVFMGAEREEVVDYVYGSRNRLDESPGQSRSVTNGDFIYTRVYMPHLPPVKYQKYADVSAILKEIREDYEAGRLNDIQSELLESRPLEYLFDLRNDPWEINNLAYKDEFESIKKELSKELERHLIKTKDVHFLPEYSMVERSSGRTPYEIRDDSKLNPLNDLIGAASLVGKDECLKQQMNFLKHRDGAVRYWAALGLRINPKFKITEKKLIDLLNNEAEPEAKIELAAMGYSRFKNAKAFDVLTEYALSGDPILANQAIQAVLYMEDGQEKFLETAEAVVEMGQRMKRKLLNASSGAEMLLYLYQGRKLTYPHFEKWVDSE